MLNVFREWLNCFRVSAPMGRGVGRRRGRSRRPAVQSMIADIQILEPRTLLSASFPQFVDPHPSVGNGFGADVVPLKNGNVVVVAPGDNAGGTNAGAAYLFNGSTGALISSLRGSHDGDFTNCSIVAVGDSHFVIVNSDWENGIGAVTWGSGTAGVSGTIGASNSLIGSHVGDNIGAGGITVLANGNYLVDSYTWANGAMTDAGAVTFGNGATGIRGVVSSTNSLVGSSAHDEVGANFSNSWWGPDVFHPPMMLPVSSPTRVFWVSRSHSLGLPPGLSIRSLHRHVGWLSSTQSRLPVSLPAEGGLSECSPSFSVVPEQLSGLASPRLRVPGYPVPRRRDCLALARQSLAA